MKKAFILLALATTAFAASGYEARFKATQTIGSGFKAPKTCKCSAAGALSGCPAKMFECVKTKK